MLKDKSAQNLQAGEILAAAGLVDAAASRYYYAMFQAAVHRLESLGLRPGRLDPGATKWKHSTIKDNVLLVRKRRSDRDLYERMRDMRVRADYHEGSIAPVELAVQVAAVRAFVQDVAG